MILLRLPCLAAVAAASAAGLFLVSIATPGVYGAQSVDSKYDFGTTIFSPKGRLYQVEYASEAVKRARPAVGICTHEGIVLCSLKTIYDTRLQVGDQREKTSRIDSHVVCVSAGLTADTMVLVRDCRASAQQHSLTFQEPIPIQKLASHVADVKQAYTQHGGLRPWGVSMLIAGWDESRGLQLYKTEPSGNFGAFKAVAVGAGAARISSELAKSYRDAGGKSGLSLAGAVRLAVKVLDAERRREEKNQDRSANSKGSGGSFRGIGMEIATIAVGQVDEDGGDMAASAYAYNDADVARVLEALDGGEGVAGEEDEKGEGAGRGAIS